MSQTKTSTRIIYSIILIVMLAGTFGMYVMATQQSPTDVSQKASLEEFERQYEKYNQDMAKWQTTKGAELSKVYFEKFKTYQNSNQAFNSAAVKELTKTDLVIGTGAELAEGTAYQAYYLGWIPSGDVFDGSFDGTSLKMPIDSQNGMIEGWKQGVIGMKIGGVREIAIPAAQAYGETGSGKIPANSPIKFVIMAIEPLSDADRATQPKLAF